MKRRIVSIFLVAAMLTVMSVSFGGCAAKDDYKPVSGLDEKQQVTLKMAIPYETNKALNTISNAFMEKYSNVNIQLEYVEDYDQNAVQMFRDGKLDIILQKGVKYAEYTKTDETTGEEIPTGKTTDDYYYDFHSDSEIDFSDTTPDISNNFLYTRESEDGGEIAYQYCYPLGGETRGVFVNVTMLKSLGCKTPTNYEEFVACCEKVKQAGFVPIQGSISTLSYGMGISYAANTIVHNDEALEAMKSSQKGASKYFKDAFSKLYNLAVNRYFDYKAIENTDYFGDISEIGQARSFLGLKYDKDSLETVKPDNNTGNVAFFPYISSTATVIENLIEEYNLDTDFTFICTPLNNSDEKSPAYITPYYGICANKNSENLVWIREFVNFMFRDENITGYAENASLIPNSKEAMQFVSQKYGVNVDTDVTLCGQINFRPDYNGFTPLGNAITTTAKCNAQKYMVELKKDKNGNISYETDENGQEYLYLGNGETMVPKQYIGNEDPSMPGYAFCTVDYFLNNLEDELAAYKVN